jgi:uncharacterized protein (UPF0335 family)
MPKPKTPTSPARPGHNSGAVDKERLRDIITRIENLENERSELASDVRDVYAEARSSGFDVRAIRRRLRRQDAAERDERQRVVDEYMSALQGLADLPLGKAALERAGLMPPV